MSVLLCICFSIDVYKVASAWISTIISGKHSLDEPTHVQVGRCPGHLSRQIFIMTGSRSVSNINVRNLCTAKRPLSTPAFFSAASTQSNAAEIWASGDEVTIFPVFKSTPAWPAVMTILGDPGKTTTWEKPCPWAKSPPGPSY